MYGGARKGVIGYIPVLASTSSLGGDGRMMRENNGKSNVC